MKNILSFELFESGLYEALPQLKPIADRPESKNIISGSTHLRKLTKKSTLNFGKWAQLTIENLIKNNETEYLRWVYFNSSNIDFMDDVLTAIGIPATVRVKKPGKDPELGKTVNKEIHKVFGYKKDINFELEKYKKIQIISKMDKENKDKVTADTDTPFTTLRFGKAEGGRAVKERPRGY